MPREPAYTVQNWRYWANVTHWGGEKTLMDLMDEGWFTRANVWNILFAGIKTWRRHTKVSESLIEATRQVEYVHMTNEEILQRDAYWEMVYPSMKAKPILEDKEEYGMLGDLKKFEESDEDDDDKY